MKLTALTLLLLLPITAYSQARDAGQAVVPRGYEDQDSIRFDIGEFMQALQPTETPNSPPGMKREDIDALVDEVQGTYQFDWGYLPADAPAGKRKGSTARSGGEGVWNLTYNGTANVVSKFTLGDMLKMIKQRIYYPSPVPMPYWGEQGCDWRYNVVNGIDDSARWYHNEYDANDISPYAEYPARPDYVVEPFQTRRFNASVDSTVLFGNEGKVILGWSDNRLLDELYQVVRNIFPHWPSGSTVAPRREEPRLFSTHLEFHVDTSVINTDSSLGLAEEDLPLLRVQILYKKGSKGPTDFGWPTLPMVPYRDSANPNNPGWWKVADVTVTKKMYRDLPETWRAEDVLESGAKARNWNFKQLYLRLDGMDVAGSMASWISNDTVIIGDTSNAAFHWGTGSGAAKFQTPKHPDSLAEEISLESTRQPLIEMRILSTYRATVRIRSVAYQDTMIDKFFLRKKDSVLSASCKIPPPGVYTLEKGGYDDSVRRVLNELRTLSGNNKPREILLNDTEPWEKESQRTLVTSVLGLFDYLGQSYNIFTHYREQDDGTLIKHIRRNRLSYDGKPPSIFENQKAFSYRFEDAEVINDSTGNVVELSRWTPRLTQAPVFPRDYIPAWREDSSSTAWPSTLDNMFKVNISRTNVTGDSLLAYKIYTEQKADDASWVRDLRSTAKVALHHPKNKRFAVQLTSEGWSQPKINGLYDSPNDRWVFDESTAFYDPFRPCTPEELAFQFWFGLANGYTSFINPEAFSAGTPGSLSVGVWGIAPRTDPDDSVTYIHGYNVGHAYSNRHLVTVYPGTPQQQYNICSWTARDGNHPSHVGDTSDVCGNLPNFYLGFSNTVRTYKRVLGRINKIYSPLNTKYPFRRFEWLDAYQARRALSTPFVVRNGEDAATYANAFLKVTKTGPVDHWQRGARGEYIDQTYLDANNVPQLLIDSAHRTYVEVGLFRDSVRPDGTPLGYAALVINSRLWPDRDSADVAYYNEGMAAKDKRVPTLGDIDVRKVYLKIDTTQMHQSMRGHYYVVRDIWHPDTTWLVHRDSQFAVYIRPGDAKFLYLQKGTTIRVSPTASTEENAFGYSNGRRIADRENGSRTVVAYTRDSMLYVSYPGEGRTFEGYHERSAADNIASGYEQLLDSNRCGHPSVSTARNDTSVAMVYYRQINPMTGEGEIRAKYQRKHGEAWKDTNFTELKFYDQTPGFGKILPVLTPVNDTTWLVATRYPGEPGKTAGIVMFRFDVDQSGQPRFKPKDYHYVATDEPGATDPPQYPTVTSRPLHDSLMPLRIAWQENGHIHRRAFTWSGSILAQAAPKRVSSGLPSGCSNVHPSIALGGHTITFFGGMFQIKVMIEHIVWEAIIEGPNGSGGNRWPVHRANSKVLLQGWVPFPGIWGAFTVFKPDSSSLPGDRWPIVAAEARKIIENSTDSGQGLRDEVRIMWHNLPAENIEGAHYTHHLGKFNWRKSVILADSGTYVALSQATDSLRFDSTNAMVDKSIAFAEMPGRWDVKITNGWVPYINTIVGYPPLFEYLLFNDTVRTQCAPKLLDRHIGYPKVSKFPSMSVTNLNWDQVPHHPYRVSDDWTINNDHKFDIASETFIVRARDSVFLSAPIDSIDVTGLRAGLDGPADYVRGTIRLLRARDTSYVATLDSLFVDAFNAYYTTASYVSTKRPMGSPNDTVFIAIDMVRGTQNVLGKGVTQYLTQNPYWVTMKQATESNPVSAHPMPLVLRVHPNPTSNTSLVTVKATEGLPTRLDLIDGLGREVMTLFDGPGTDHELQLVLEADQLPAGTYFVRVVSGGQVQTAKLQVVR
jgi:hypothetical protein